MILSVKNAIVRAIASTNESYEVFDEPVEQNLEEPCFRIMNVMNHDSRRVDRRNYFESTWDICYFPKSEDAPEQECHAVEWKILRALRMINLVDDNGREWAKVHGTERHSEIVDGVLHIYADYNIFYMDCEELADKLNKLELNIFVVSK